MKRRRCCLGPGGTIWRFRAGLVGKRLGGKVGLGVCLWLDMYRVTDGMISNDLMGWSGVERSKTWE